MKVMASSKRYQKPVSEDGTITPDIMTTEEDKKNYERDQYVDVVLAKHRLSMSKFKRPINLTEESK